MTRIFWSILAVVMFGAMLITPAAPVAAQSGERCFAETGLCISGPIRSYWERNGGLPVFGYPITAQAVETVEDRTLQVQWFERDRLEIQADGIVTAGRLGVERLEQQGIFWQQLPGDDSALRGCRFFRETQFNLCEPFLSYWEKNGGLERFGYPVTRQRSEILEGKEYNVQYFERRRMEYHPENRGTPYEVLLGLLGREVLTVRNGGVVTCEYTSPLLRKTIAQYLPGPICFLPYNGVDENVTIAIQPFQGGEMIWLPARTESAGTILVIYRTNGVISGWSWYLDSYIEGERLAEVTPPPGLYAPIRGFGKIWRTVPEVRDRLGWATSPEAGMPGAVVNSLGRFGFTWVVLRKDTDSVYILRPGDGAFEVARVR